MQDLNRIRYISSNFNFLQGLKLLPVGLYCLVVAVAAFDWLPGFSLTQPDNWNVIAVVVVFFAEWLIGDYYRRNYGQRINQPDSRTTWHWAAFAFGSLIFVVAGLLLDQYVKFPVSLAGLMVAASLCSYCLLTARWRSYYLTLIIIVVTISVALPLSGMEASSNSFKGILFVVLGVGMLICGLLDHLQLSQAFKPPTKG